MFMRNDVSLVGRFLFSFIYVFKYFLSRCVSLYRIMVVPQIYDLCGEEVCVCKTREIIQPCKSSALYNAPDFDLGRTN